MVSCSASEVGLSLHSPEHQPQRLVRIWVHMKDLSALCLLLCSLAVLAGFITKLSSFLQRKKCVVAVADQDDGDAVSGDSMVPAVCESVAPEENTQTPTACTKPSKWEEFLSCSDSCSKNAARVTLSPQEGSGRLELHSTTAAEDGVASRCLEQAGRALPPGTGFEFKKHVANTERLALKLPGTSSSCSVEDDVLFGEPQSQLVRAGSGVSGPTAGRCCLESMRRANALVNCNTGPNPSSVSCEHLFCTGEEFDDDL